MRASAAFPITERTAALIREWAATVDHAAGPKPMALPYLAVGDPVALAGITLRTIHEGISAGSMGLARLALIVGATADREAASGHRGAGWSTEAQMRVGLALIDCAMRANAGWFSLASALDGSSRAAMALGPRLVLAVRPGAMDAVCYCLGREAPQAESYRPTIRPLAPPYGVIRTIMGRQTLQVSMIEAAEDLLGGDIKPGRSVLMARA